jgi:predicted ArsR family transcriptional regulator
MAEADPVLALLSSPVRRRILSVLGAAEPPEADGLGGEGLTAAQLAKQLSLHVTTVRFHLDQLVAAGLVEASFHKHIGAGRPRKVYARVKGPAAAVSSRDSLLLLSTLLTEAFSAQTEHQRPLSPDEAGWRWARENVTAEDGEPAVTAGQWIAKLGRAIDVLTAWGYEPALAADASGRDARIELTHCPFRELARENTAVVCGIHRGLIAGTMSQLGEPDTTVDLQPFADGDVCIARLRSAAHLPLAPSPLPPNPPAARPTGNTKETR